MADKHVKFVYNALGQTQKVTRYSNAAGTTEEGHSDYEYDKYAHTTLISHERTNNTVLASYGYAYDHLNRVTSADLTTASEDVTTYSYDATDQLIGVDRASGSDESYVHDLNGNRRMSGTTNYSVSANNQVFRDGTFEYTYDKEGNLTKRVTLVSGSPTGVTTEYTWDNRNRLTKITEKASPGGSATKTVDYGYDVHDLRVSKTVNTNAAGDPERYEFYVWDGDDIVLDFVDADGGVSPAATFDKRYLWGQAVDQILAQETSAGVTAWHLADMLGSVRDLMDNTSELVSGSHVGYDAFGKILSGTPATRFAFTAQEWDADAGLYYYNARWYDPRTGKFLSIDPKGFAAGDTNLLRMVGNSVTNAVDPSGNVVVEVVMQSYIPFKSLVTPDGRIFSGDDRKGADKTIGKADNDYRSRVYIKIDTCKPFGKMVTISIDAGVTHEVDENGKVIDWAEAKEGDEMHHDVGVSFGDSGMLVSFNGDARNPLMWYAPSIDYSFGVWFYKAGLWSGKIFDSASVTHASHDGFPAYEVYARIEGEGWKELYRFEPASADEVTKLFTPSDVNKSDLPKIPLYKE